MTAPRARPILWDLYEEHLDEAAWLWGVWEEALDSAVHALDDVAVGPEERLLAHLDGLVLGGLPVAQKLLLPALAGDDAGRVAAAAWALAQAEHGDHQDAIIGALASAEAPGRAAIARALSLSPRADLSRLVPLWNSAKGPVQAIVLDVFGPREPDWLRARLDAALRGAEPSLCAAALRAVCRLGDQGFLTDVQQALASDDPAIRLEAINAGIRLGARPAWTACRQAATAPGDACRLPLGLLATSPDPNDRVMVRERARLPEVKRHALWALGFAGDVDSADALVEALADEEVAKVAGEAFTSITGLAITGPFANVGEHKGPDANEVSDDDPPPIVQAEDFLPVPKEESVTKWWDKERARFRPGMRYLHGQPRDARALRAGLVTATTWRRNVLWLELASLGAQPPVVDLKTWSRDQQRLLETDG